MIRNAKAHTLNFLDENKLFHQAVADASGNRQLAELARRLQLPLVLYQTSGALTPEILALSNVEHRAIANAILTGDLAHIAFPKHNTASP